MTVASTPSFTAGSTESFAVTPNYGVSSSSAPRVGDDRIRGISRKIGLSIKFAGGFLACGLFAGGGFALAQMNGGAPTMVAVSDWGGPLRTVAAD